MKFKIGDKVVWARNTIGIEGSPRDIVLGGSFKISHIESRESGALYSKKSWVHIYAEDELELLDIYNSPLYNALREGENND